MTATTADRAAVEQNIHVKQMCPPIGVAASTTIPAGVLVMQLAGVAVNGADTAAAIFLGISEERVDNAAGAASALSIGPSYGHTYRLAGSSIVAADVGKICCILDNQTVALAGGTTNAVEVGEIMGVPATDVVDVRLRVAATKA